MGAKRSRSSRAVKDPVLAWRTIERTAHTSTLRHAPLRRCPPRTSHETITLRTALLHLPTSVEVDLILFLPVQHQYYSTFGF